MPKENSSVGYEPLPEGGAVREIAKLVHPDLELKTLNRGQYMVMGSKDAYDIVGSLPLATPTTMECRSLSSIVDAFNANIHKGFDVTVQVVGPTEVVLVSPCVGEERQRFVWARATADVPIFPFDKFLDVLPFIVLGQTTIIESDARTRVLQYVAKMTNGVAETIEDDGVKQIVTTRKGAAETPASTFQNPVSLQPYRTFSEITQPESNFVLRVETQGNDPENLQGRPGLFLADGGAWRIKAMADIAAFLRQQLGDKVPVVA